MFSVLKVPCLPVLENEVVGLVSIAVVNSHASFLLYIFSFSLGPQLNGEEEHRDLSTATNQNQGDQAERASGTTSSRKAQILWGSYLKTNYIYT